jgi:hypothetical protein
METPDATLAHGCFQLPPSARGVLVLANPPEAGWRMRGTEQRGCGQTGTARRSEHESGCDQHPGRGGSG